MIPIDHARAALEEAYLEGGRLAAEALDELLPAARRATRWREGCPPYTEQDSRERRLPAPTTPEEWAALNAGSKR